MRFQLCTAVVLILGAVAGAQVASHAPSAGPSPASAKAAARPQGVLVQDKPVARVNGAALTDRDLVREMYLIFPYARQHNGFPKELEPEIRRGALEMIIFEELVYQEAKRRGMAMAPARLAKAEADLRKQFPSQAAYEQFIRTEFRGSKQALRDMIRRSLLIEALLKAELDVKAAVSPAEAKAFYDKNPKRFEHGEQFSLQTISIMPPQGANSEVLKEARTRAETALRQARATKSYREFGLLAEKISDDDWHVNMGDRKQVERAQLPLPLVQAALKMKPGEVSDLVQLGQSYTLFRLNDHRPAGKTEFAAVQKQLQTELQKAKYDGLRAEFHKKLRKSAKVEVLNPAGQG